MTYCSNHFFYIIFTIIIIIITLYVIQRIVATNCINSMSTNYILPATKRIGIIPCAMLGAYIVILSFGLMTKCRQIYKVKLLTWYITNQFQSIIALRSSVLLIFVWVGPNTQIPCDMGPSYLIIKVKTQVPYGTKHETQEKTFRRFQNQKSELPRHFLLKGGTSDL